MPDKETKMRAHTVSYVSFTEVLSRLGLPSQEDVHEVEDRFFAQNGFAWDTNSFSLVPWHGRARGLSLVPWSVLADDLSDCMIEMGYDAPDINTIYPKTVLAADQLHPTVDRAQRELYLTEYIYVDLES